MQESCSLPALLDLCTLGPWKYQSCPPSRAQPTLHRAAANSPSLPKGEVAGRGAIFFLNYFLQYLRSSRSFFWITSLSSLSTSKTFALSSELPMPSSPSRWRVVINSRCNSSGGKKGSPMENPMHGGAWWAAVHGVTKSRTRLSDFTFTFHFHALEREMATHSSVLVWRNPGMGEPGGLPSMGSQSRTRLKRLSSSSSSSNHGCKAPQAMDTRAGRPTRLSSFCWNAVV